MLNGGFGVDGGRWYWAGFLLCLVFLAQISRAERVLNGEDRQVWVRAIKRVQMKPPCCGACEIITQKETKMIWAYLTSLDPETRQGKYLEVWNKHKGKLLEEFKMLSPERFSVLYSTGVGKSAGLFAPNTWSKGEKNP